MRLNATSSFSIYKAGILLLLGLIFGQNVADAQPLQTKATRKLVEDLLLHGQESMEAGDYETATEDFLRARRMDPQNPVCSVRLAQAWFLREEYGKSASAVKNFINTKKANPECYQVYGNAMDLQGKSVYAAKIYRQGLTRFPAAGILHMELGIQHFAEGRMDSALFHWENGINSDPWFPSNYYWAAKACHQSGEYLWATLYAEFYMNLDRTSERSAEMGKLLFDAFRKSIVADSSGAMFLHFHRPDSAIKPVCPEFDELYEEMFSMAVRDSGEAFTVEQLTGWQDFVHHLWFSDEDANKFKVSLFDWHRLMEKQGFLEAYLHWLVYDAAPRDFGEWVEENEGYWQSFEQWFLLNGLSLHVKRHLSRQLLSK